MAKVKFALIPPIQFLPDTFATDYQLMLPHMLRNEAYAQYYKSLCDSSEQYVILDNGAAEAVDSYDAQALLLIAEHYGVDEVIASDVMSNASVTYSTTRQFIKVVEDMDYRGRVGMVAQGHDIAEAFDLVKALIDECSRLATVYIPRLLVTGTHLTARLDLSRHIHEWNPDIEMHLLGASRFYPSEVYQAAIECPWIRGMDTSMPYVFGQYGASVSEIGFAPPHRDSNEDYFFGHWNDLLKEVSHLNVKRMLKWAVGVG